MAPDAKNVQTTLFFDDQRLNRLDNIVRKVGKPERIPGSIYRDPYVNTSWGYPSVFHDEASGKWRMVYQGKNDAYHKGQMPLLAESDDGLNWTPRDTTLEANLPDRKVPHQLLPLDSFGEWPTCYLDPRAEPAERVKGLVVYHPKKDHLSTRLWVSADGLHWTLKRGVEWQELGPDPGVGVFWNDVRKSHVITTRPMWSDRRVAILETRDWQSFTKPELLLQADALDTRLAEPYGMLVFPYCGYYIGLLWIYHCIPQINTEPGLLSFKFHGGHVDCQLIYSLNGWHFQRGLREPLIPNGDPGQPDSGCVYPSSMVLKPNGEIWIYAAACTHEHAYTPPGSGSILTYRLRKDGFVFLKSRDGVGVIGTRAMFWKGGQFELNIESQSGTARAQITDHSSTPLEGFSFEDCAPFSGDDTAWSPSWKTGKNPAALAGRIIRLEVELENARLYAIRGNFLPVTMAEWRRFVHEGLLPEGRLGF